MTIKHNKGFFKDEKILAEISVTREDFGEIEISPNSFENSRWSKTARVQLIATMKPESWKALCDTCKGLRHDHARQLTNATYDGGKVARDPSHSLTYRGIRTEEKKEEKFNKALDQIKQRIEEKTPDAMIQEAIAELNATYAKIVESIRKDDIVHSCTSIMSEGIMDQVDKSLMEQDSFVDTLSEIEEAEKALEAAEKAYRTALQKKAQAQKTLLLTELNETPVEDAQLKECLIEKVESWEIDKVGRPTFKRMRRG